VKYLSIPNLLAGEPIYPELIQGRATAGNIAAAALELLADPARHAAPPYARNWPAPLSPWADPAPPAGPPPPF